MKFSLARTADACYELRVTVFGIPPLDVHRNGYAHRLCDKASAGVVPESADPIADKVAHV